jgi:hypothetical protein
MEDEIVKACNRMERILKELDEIWGKIGQCSIESAPWNFCEGTMAYIREELEIPPLEA